MLLVALVAGACVYGVAHLDINGSTDVPDDVVERFQSHEAVLRAEGDRLLREAGVDPTKPTSSCTFDPAHRPPTHATADASPEVQAALTDLGIGKRYVSYCAAVFSIRDAVGFGADHPDSLLYRGTELYSLDTSCAGLMGATLAAVPLAPDWYVGFALDC